ncbi:xanthine dehydrogenase family protein molybdopterin-binding subunit [Streptomyces sp. NPDC059861]|uniref:xanthine dehydrogenase family protein molybdopterin-binding subunit n=1 Tax=Streptomyces sp. NPDC059861 TaxID=3346974 RepID=UPI00366996C0
MTSTNFSQIDVGPGSPIGAATRRRDGRDKVTGTARYAAEFQPEGMLYAALVTSTVPSGTITAIDTEEAQAMPGVRMVLTHLNATPLFPALLFPFGAAFQSLLPLQDERIRFSGQPVGLVVADTFEQATEAATRVRVAYRTEPFIPDGSHPDATTFGAEDCGKVQEMVPDLVMGDPDTALAAAPVTLDVTYSSPRHYHAAMELHSTTAHWSPDGTLTVWEPTQWTAGARAAFAQWFKLPLDQVRVISPYVGGGFGSKGGLHPHAAVTAMAAREVGQPVKLVLTRPQQFTCTSPRPATRQHLRLGADHDGKLTALTHDSLNETSFDDLYIEASATLSALTYSVPNARSRYRFVRVNAVTPGSMRGPGETMGSFALESAMDELAVALKLDPIELRLRNYSDRDQLFDKPWSTKGLRQAYEQGATAFGWQDRDPNPRSMRNGTELIGWGMAGGAFPCYSHPTSAGVRVHADGTIEVFSGGSDIGTGTYTLLAQVAADVFGLPADEVAVRLGDSAYPEAAVAGGSMLAGALTPVTHQAATAVRDELIQLASTLPGTPLHGREASELAVGQGRVHLARSPDTGLRFTEILSACGRKLVEAVRDTFGDISEQDRKDNYGTLALLQLPAAGTHSVYSWSSIFAEVGVDEELGTVRLKRLVGAFDCGRILNPTTARSQLIGGMIMASGAALLEAGVVDARQGRLANPNLAEYVVPVNADIPEIEVLFAGEPDPHSNPLGSKAIGELGMTGVPAAIANAVYHATGRRVRDLPILMEKML